MPRGSAPPDRDEAHARCIAPPARAGAIHASRLPLPRLHCLRLARRCTIADHLTLVVPRSAAALATIVVSGVSVIASHAGVRIFPGVSGRSLASHLPGLSPVAVPPASPGRLVRILAPGSGRPGDAHRVCTRTARFTGELRARTGRAPVATRILPSPRSPSGLRSGKRPGREPPPQRRTSVQERCRFIGASSCRYTVWG